MEKSSKTDVEFSLSVSYNGADIEFSFFVFMKYLSFFLFAGVAILSASSVALASAPAFYSASSLIFTDINTPRNNVSFFVEGFS